MENRYKSSNWQKERNKEREKSCDEKKISSCDSKQKVIIIYERKNEWKRENVVKESSVKKESTAWDLNKCMSSVK